MRFKLTAAVIIAVALLDHSGPLTGQTQPRIFAEGGGVDDRGSARVLYWDRQANTAAGQFAINYGRPAWKAGYEDPAKFDSLTKGKVWRLGSNFWTVLSTDLPLEISGKRIKPGEYYLGMRRSADGSKWSLAFINPSVARRDRVDAFDIAKAPVDFEVPMTEAKPEGKADKLTITLAYTQQDIRNITLRVAWGDKAFTAPVRVTLHE